MRSARLLLGLFCGALSLALLSGCETERAACEREKRLTERLDEMQMDLDGRISGVNMEVASMRANPPVIVQQVPTPMEVPVNYNAAPTPSAPGDFINIEDEYSKAQQLQAIANRSREAQLYEAPPPPRSSGGQSNAAKHIRVPVPVRTVQAALKEAGFYRGNVDGKVGRQTISAITEFQRSQGIKADGICGRQTWNLLAPYAPAGAEMRRLK